LELSKKSWLLAIQFPDREQPSVYSIKGGDTEKLMAKLTAARDCWAKVSGSLPVITLCYEVGYDAFWLARFLKARGIECLVIDPGSLQVNRRGRRVKTDRVDVKMLLRTLIAWCRGERHVWSPVRIPSVEEEDLRRSHRERSRLVRERTAHINRIKGLLFAQGIRDVNVKSQYKTLAVDKLLTADGHRLPPRLASEIARELQRLAMVQEQIAESERERDTAPTPCEATERKRRLLASAEECTHSMVRRAHCRSKHADAKDYDRGCRAQAGDCSLALRRARLGATGRDPQPANYGQGKMTG
jgi:transposase